MRQACQRSLPPAYRRGHTVSRGFGEPQSYLLSVCCDGRGVGRAARRLHCASGSMEATSVQVASVLGTACRKCDRVDTTEARRLQSGAVQSTSAISALVASVADPKAFRSGRDFSTWIGLVPKQNSSGGKEKLGSITKRGDRYLRSLFTAGALAVIRYAKIHGINHRPWLTALLARRPTKVAAVSRTLSNWWCKYIGTRTLAKDESLGARLIVVRLA
jgi:hypothetical protein